MQVEIVELPEARGAGILHVGPYDTLGADFDRLGAWMVGHLAHLRGAPRCLYLDDVQETAARELRTWVVIPVSEDLELTDEDAPVQSCPLPGGRHLKGVHRGSYEGLAQAWPDFMAAVEASGEVPDPSRHCSEVYASDPRETPEEQLVTELYQPIV